MAENRRQQIIDWLRNSGNPDSDSLLKSLYQMNTDEWEQKHRKDLRKIMGYADLEKSTVSLRNRARGEFDTYIDNPEWYIKGKAAKLGVNVNDLKKALSELEEERIWNEGRDRRAKEVNDEFIWNFAPKSSQQRYIDDPNATIFGKEGKYNPYSKEGQDDLRDVMLGVAGTVGDFIPGYGAAVGPAARLLRNEELIRTNSKYAPSMADAGKELANDAATFGAAAWLQNFRQAKRMAGGATKELPGLSNINKNLKTTSEIDNTLNGLNSVFTSKSYEEAIKAVENLPDNQVKSNLLKKIENFKGIGDPKAEADLVKDLRMEALDNQLNVFTTVGRYPEGYKVIDPNKTKEIFIKNSDNAAEGAARAEKALNDTKSLRQQVRNTPTVGKVGQIIRDKVLPAYGGLEQGLAKNATTLYKASPADKDREKVDWYKQNYARDWAVGFVPKGKETDPIMRAYNEWLAEQGPSINKVFGE